MKKVLIIAIVCFICFISNAQVNIFKNSFMFKKTKIDYLTTVGIHNNGVFYVVIKNENISLNEFNNNLKKCLLIKKSLHFDYYYLVIPKYCSMDKEKLVLEFINNILSKKKLFENEMNIISDDNYFKLYEDTRKNEFEYKSQIYRDRKEIAKEKNNLVKDSLKNILNIKIRNHHTTFSSLNKICNLTILKNNTELCVILK